MLVGGRGCSAGSCGRPLCAGHPFASRVDRQGFPQPTERMGSWDRIADHFINCILDGVACEAPLQHGLVVQKMMEGLLHSAEIGKPVSFE